MCLFFLTFFWHFFTLQHKLHFFPSLLYFVYFVFGMSVHKWKQEIHRRMPLRNHQAMRQAIRLRNPRLLQLPMLRVWCILCVLCWNPTAYVFFAIIGRKCCGFRFAGFICWDCVDWKLEAAKIHENRSHFNHKWQAPNDCKRNTFKWHQQNAYYHRLTNGLHSAVSFNF